MPAIGVTGGISTGKSSFVECLRVLAPRARFFDADVAARELADSDAEVRGLIEKEFGAGVYSAVVGGGLFSAESDFSNGSGNGEIRSALLPCRISNHKRRVSSISISAC